MRPFALAPFALAAALAALAAPAAAQFNAFAWTLDATAGGTGSTSGDGMNVVGPDFGFGSGCPNGHTTSFTTTTPYAATVVVNFSFVSEDKGGNEYDWPVYLIDGVETQITQYSTDGDLVFDVPAGSTLGFGVHSFDCVAGPGVLTLNGLQYVRHDLGPSLAGNEALEQLGTAVASAGDVDGDGVPDVLVGAPHADSPLVDAGSVTLASGADGTQLRLLAGSQAHEAFGSAVAGGADVNGDGVPDVLVGSPLFDLGPAADVGAVRVFSGADGHQLLSVVDHFAAGDKFGAAVAFVGDINGDGHADLAVGAPFNDLAGANAGLVLILSGTNGAVLRMVTGSAPGDEFGAAVAAAGDIDGDGVPDAIVGAPFADVEGTDSGSASVVSGATGAVLLLLHGAPQLPQDFGDHFGFSVAGAGDVDGDGRPDLIVGAPDDGYGLLGSAWVFSGATGAVLDHIDGVGVAPHLGSSVAGAGDVDGDGHADFVVGESRWNGSDTQEGRVFVFAGRDGSLLAAVTHPNIPEVIGDAVAGAGDIDGDGLADVIVGAPGGGLDGAGSAFVLLPRPLFTYLGGSVAGTHGEPQIAGTGLLFAGAPFTVKLSRLLENVPCTLVVGLGLLQAPFKGGVLVPSPDILIAGLHTGPAGGFTLSGKWPAGIPAGLALYVQGWLPDPAAAQAFAATQGLRLSVP